MRILLTLIVLLAASWIGTASGQQDIHIEELSSLDRQFMAQQRALLNDISARNFGRRFGGSRDGDLDLLQTLLDKKLVRKDQTRELQSMGVIIGDHLAVDLDMHWVIYQDNIGRSRALRYRETDNYLFPMTMVSRRREAGNTTSIGTIYRKAYDIIDNARPALPFQ